MGRNNVATAKTHALSSYTVYSTRGGSHIQLHRPILEGAVLLCSVETPWLFSSWNKLQQWLP